jgi:glutathione S-transferase
MSIEKLKLYNSSASPNARRVRIFLAEKGLQVPQVPVDLGKGEQHSDAYRAVNPRRVVPTLLLEDGTATCPRSTASSCAATSSAAPS